MSSRLQDHPEVDDMQQRCAMRAAKLRDIEVTTGMSVNLSNSILHFSMDEIIHNANQVGVSLGNTNSEISNSVNDLLDLEAERALETIRNLAAVRPMNDAEIDALGVGLEALPQTGLLERSSSLLKGFQIWYLRGGG